MGTSGEVSAQNNVSHPRQHGGKSYKSAVEYSGIGVAWLALNGPQHSTGDALRPCTPHTPGSQARVHVEGMLVKVGVSDAWVHRDNTNVV